jgi:hypothetical protein
MSQALQEYEEMADLHRRVGTELGVPPDRTVQMLARLGRSSYSYRSPRRPVQSMVIV